MHRRVLGIQMVKEQCPDVTEEWLQSVVLAVNEEYVEPDEKVRVVSDRATTTLLLL